MPDVATDEIFKDALEAEGVTDADVLTHDDKYGNRKINVRKQVNGDIISADFTISDRELAQLNNVKKHVATLASRAARDLKERLTEQHKWGEKAVELDLKEDKTATCLRCGAEVSIDDLQDSPVGMSETAVPQPVTYSADSLPPLKLRMALLALLKDECEPQCPNSPVDPMTVHYDRKI